MLDVVECFQLKGGESLMKCEEICGPANYSPLTKQ